MPPELLLLASTWALSLPAAAVMLASTDATAPVIGGVAGLLGILGAALLRELNRSSGGAWRIVKDKNRQLHRKDWEIAHWQWRAGVGENPGPYMPPTEEEISTW